jgi:hypothetical protein
MMEQASTGFRCAGRDIFAIFFDDDDSPLFDAIVANACFGNFGIKPPSST